MEHFNPFSLNINGRLVNFNRPAVMSILNITPDSFFGDSRKFNSTDIKDAVLRIIEEGTDMIDIGGYSSRPGADDVSVDEELRRIDLGMNVIRNISTTITVSVDTFRSEVAEKAVKELGVDMVNDISGGDLDDRMFPTIAELGVPYVLMHTRGKPSNMQQLTDYGKRGVLATVFDDLGEKINRLALLGVCDVIVDPGFGFAKTLEQNYEIMRELAVFKELECPILVGVSRKSMITKLLDITSCEALNATTALNAFALDRGASILRVHDTKQAVEAVKVYCSVAGIEY